MAIQPCASDPPADEHTVPPAVLRSLPGPAAAPRADLIGALAVDGGFRNPSFAAPVTRLEGSHAEVFTIIAEVGASP